MGAAIFSPGRQSAPIQGDERDSSDRDGTSVCAVADKVVGYLREGRRALIAAHFRVGDEIRDLRNNAAYGRRAVAALAEELGMDESGLQRWGRLAETVRGDEREALCDQVDAHGMPLTPSLLVELERVRDRNARVELARTVLDRGLSVRQLRTLVTALSKRRSPNAPNKPTNLLRGGRRCVNVQAR
jgi:hypothetical protein